jgi:Na+/melibiose symporter-like transporter
MVPFALKYWIKVDEDYFSLLLVAYLTVAVCAVPLWVRLSSKIGKKWAYFVSLIWSTVSLAAMFFLRPGALIPIAIIFGIAGAAYGALWILSLSILADIIDYDELKSGERREGIYFGSWTFMQKVTVAAASACMLEVMAKIGYVPDQEQAAHTILGIRVLIALVPAVMYGIAALILLRFPFTRQVHHEIQNALRQKRQAAHLE